MLVLRIIESSGVGSCEMKDYLSKNLKEKLIRRYAKIALIHEKPWFKCHDLFCKS